jgi:hypothetical protein
MTEVVKEMDPSPDAERDESFCPECGQSLDLARHAEAPVKRRTLEPFVFLFFGLCLLVVFGTRAWNAHLQFSSVDQQIAALRVQTLTSKLDDTMGEVLEQQRNLQLGFQQDIAGLGLGLLTLIVGAVSWLHERPEVADGQQNGLRPQHLPPSRRSQVGRSPWELGALVATTLVRMLLLLFVSIVGLQLIRGSPPSLQLVDEALTRIIAIVVTITSPLQ